MNFNIQSFESKFDEFSVFLDEINTKPHVLILTETWFAPSKTREILTKWINFLQYQLAATRQVSSTETSR